MTSSHKLLLRILCDIVIVVSIFVMPWWIPVGIVLVAVVYFDRYSEIIIAGFMIDSLYGTPIKSWHNFSLFFTTSAIPLFLMATYTKQKFSFDVR